MADSATETQMRISRYLRTEPGHGRTDANRTITIEIVRSQTQLWFIRYGGAKMALVSQFLLVPTLFTCLQGLRKYLQFGLGLEIARNLIYNYNLILKRPTSILSIFFTRLNWNLIAFLPSYVAIYRVSPWSFLSLDSFHVFFNIWVRQLPGKSTQYPSKWQRVNYGPQFCRVHQWFGVHAVPESNHSVSHGDHHNWSLLETLLRSNQSRASSAEDLDGSSCLSPGVRIFVAHSSIHTLVGSIDVEENHAFHDQLQVSRWPVIAHIRNHWNFSIFQFAEMLVFTPNITRSSLVCNHSFISDSVE